MNTAKTNTLEQKYIRNEELEKTVITSLLTTPYTIADSADILSSDCFYNRQYREIFEAIDRIYRRGDSTDMSMVASELAKGGSNISFIDLAQICMNTTPVYISSQHSLLLRDYAYRRKLCEVGYELINTSSDESHPSEEIHNKAKSKIATLYEDCDTRMETLATTCKALQEHIIKNHELKDGTCFGTPTGFPDLDKNGGLCAGDLIVVGAETSQGKTSFATALSVSAIEHGEKVAFYSMEMSPLQLTARIASMKSGISSSQILYNKLTEEEITQIESVITGIDSQKMFFDGRSNSSLDSILSSIRKMKMKYDIQGAVVDYLQLVNISERTLNREQATAKCARDLKNLAKELGIWIICISQLSRNQQNPIPSLCRLRDSGQIEEAADNIYLIYRPREKGAKYPEPFENEPTQGTALVYVAKGRNSGTGQFICGFKAENTLFYPISERELFALRARQAFGSVEKGIEDENIAF